MVAAPASASVVVCVAATSVGPATPMLFRAIATPMERAAVPKAPPATATDADTIVAMIEDVDAAVSVTAPEAPTLLPSMKALVRERTVLTAAAPAPLAAPP